MWLICPNQLFFFFLRQLSIFKPINTMVSLLILHLILSNFGYVKCYDLFPLQYFSCFQIQSTSESLTTSVSLKDWLCCPGW